jgi:glycosyltransferase involved in cell wall biosynthesis
MRILVAHNRYQQVGAEDSVFENEVKLLAAAGHQVRTLLVSNETISSYFDKALTILRVVENPDGIAAMCKALKEFRPDVVHIHNFFPLLSPAVHSAIKRAGSATVQTLHNYRPICASGQLLRDGRACYLCVHGSPMWGIRYRCFRNSIIGSSAVACMIAAHRKRETWSTDVDRFIVPSEFGRRLFTDAGFPGDRIEVKPNFIEDPGEAPHGIREGVLFAGRLSEVKGTEVLLDACAQNGFPLRIAGEGPESARLRSSAPSNVIFLGQLSRDAVLEEMRRAAVVVVPSLWNEPFGLVILEAFACETPVVASRLGALSEIIDDGETGFLVPAGAADKLGERIRQLLESPELSRRFGRAGRQTFLKKYTPANNLAMLENIYAKAIVFAAHWNAV